MGCKREPVPPARMMPFVVGLGLLELELLELGLLKLGFAMEEAGAEDMTYAILVERLFWLLICLSGDGFVWLFV
jgi:hypothetical protein